MAAFSCVGFLLDIFVNRINHISSKKAKARSRGFTIEVLFSFKTKVHALALVSRLSQSASSNFGPN